MADSGRMLPPSSIPQPSTAKKQQPAQQTMRMSLAGPAIRGPLLNHSTDLGNNHPRQSTMYRSQNSNPLLQSTSKQPFGRTPVSKRLSTWNGGATAATSISQPVKDQRPLRDRAYQSKLREEVVDFLQQIGYDISAQTMKNITGKEYRNMFNCLVGYLDEYYPLHNPAADGRLVPFEEEFVPALKALRYPFVQQIDNKWLAAPASMHSWPTLLGVLHWLVTSCILKDSYLDSGAPTLQNRDNVPDDFDDSEHHKAIAVDFIAKTYLAFLNGADDFAELVQEVEDVYKHKDKKVQADLDAKTDLLHKSIKELEKLDKSAPPVESLEEEYKLITRDAGKFRIMLEQYEQRGRKVMDAIAAEKLQIEAEEARLAELRTEQERLADVVKTQNLSPEEVMRMNTEHEQLSRNLEDLKQKIAETQRISLNLEVNVTNRAAEVEEVVDSYNHTISTLGLFPPHPISTWENTELRLELNTAASTPGDLLIGADIRKAIKPTLSSIAKSRHARQTELENERIAVDNELEQLLNECETQDEELATAEKNVAMINEQADRVRDAAQADAQTSSAEADRLEKDLAQARDAALAHGMGMKSRLQSLQFNYGEQVEKVNRLRDELVRVIRKNSSDIALFKDEVSKHLTQLKDFVQEDNVG